MKKTKWLILACVILVTLLGLCAVRFAMRGRWMTASQANRWVSEALPYGSSHEEVEAWLDAQHIEHVSAFDDDGRLDHISGKFPDPMLSLLFGGEIYLNFSFDKDGKLVKRLVRPDIIGF